MSIAASTTSTTTSTTTRGYSVSLDRDLYECINEIMIGAYYPDGSCTGELAIRWYDIGSVAPAARLEVFEDSWPLLATMGDLLAELAVMVDMESIRLSDVTDLLDDLGFTRR